MSPHDKHPPGELGQAEEPLQNESRRDFLKTTTVAGAALAAPAILTSGLARAADGPVKIGHLEDLSGNLAVYGLQKDHAAQLAVAEINAGLALKGGPVGSGGLGAFGNAAGRPPLMGTGSGDLNYLDDGGERSNETVAFIEDDDILVESGDEGILGRPVELINLDGQSNNNIWQQLTRKLIQGDKVDCLIAGFTSAEREAIRPIVDQFKQLYIYTNQYEGGVADANTFCTGAICEQQVIPVVDYMVQNFGPRIYTIAADYNFGQLTAAWTKATAPLVGGEIIEEEFVPLSVSDFSTSIARIQAAKPDWVFTLLVGTNQSNYYPQAAAAGLEYPMASTVNMAQGYEHPSLRRTVAEPDAQLRQLHRGGSHQAQPGFRQALVQDVPGRSLHRANGPEHLFLGAPVRQRGPARRHHRAGGGQARPRIGDEHRGARGLGVHGAGHPPRRPIHSAGGRRRESSRSVPPGMADDHALVAASHGRQPGGQEGVQAVRAR